jgi:hypothetical protein
MGLMRQLDKTRGEGVRLFRRRTPEDELAVRQRKIADLFARTARQMSGLDFDYTDRSIERLDDWADHLWDPEGPAAEDEEIETSATSMGSYFGEVVVCNLGGRWVWVDDLSQPGIETPEGVAMVLQRAFTRQVEGRAKSFVDYYGTLAAQFAKNANQR